MMRPNKTGLVLKELEAVVRLTLMVVPGCEKIEGVVIVRDFIPLHHQPNWDISEIRPPVPEKSCELVHRAIEQLRQKFELVTP